MTKCYLDDPDNPQCCCNCEHRLYGVRHCNGTAKSADGDGCGCKDRIMYLCAAPSFHPRVYLDWPEHSCGCECYEAKKP